MIASNDSPGKESAAVVRRALESIGFEVKLRSLDQSAFYDLCQTLEDLKRIDVCMNFGWLPDFIDPYAMLNSNFNGDAIVPEGNNNPSLQDDPAINKAMNDAALIADDAERAKAWGDIDRKLVENAVAIPWYWDNVGTSSPRTSTASSASGTPPGTWPTCRSRSRRPARPGSPAGAGLPGRLGPP